jgi:hypothetical protein
VLVIAVAGRSEEALSLIDEAVAGRPRRLVIVIGDSWSDQ